MTESAGSSSAVDDVWASLKDGETERLSEYRRRSAALKSKSQISVVDLIKKTEKKDKEREKLVSSLGSADLTHTTSKDKKKKKTVAAKCISDLGTFSELSMSSTADNVGHEKSKHFSFDLKGPHASNVVKRPVAGMNTGEDQMEKNVLPDSAFNPILIRSNEMSSKIARDLNSANADDVNERRRALQKLYKTLFTDYTMTTIDYNEIFRDSCRAIFKKFSDSSEKCRELSLRITHSFFECASDFVPVLAYFFPMLMQRLPGGLAYDEDMKVFVTDMETHEAYRRGKAVERQDKTGGAAGALTHSVVEESEEIRNLSCKVLGTLLKRTIAIGASSVLHPYFHEIVMYLQMQLRDPFPDLKAEACNVLELLARTEEFNSGMKFFAVALVRASLPVLRHRHAKVRAAAVRCLNCCMVVPDRAKVKGSGTEAIADLVGFREENVLQVAAFYRADVQINYLAELVTDDSVPVKESVVHMLGQFMTEIGDRYDHQTRLLPYLLDLLTDEAETVSSSALCVLRRCGQQYEEEHPDEIIEKRQYGVDGDNTINLLKPLPKPFTERPRIGMRLYVRGNSKRFLTALVNELTNWLSATRSKSAKLLKLIVCLCEEHLTMEIHTLLPSLIKALRFANDDSDKDKDGELHCVLLEVFELVGRYVSPGSYVHYILPRLRGDAEVSSFGADAATRIAVMQALQALIEGSRPSQVVPFFSEIVSTLTDTFIIDPDSPRLVAAALRVLLTMLTSIQGKGQAAVEAQYVATGRLSTLRSTISKLFRFFLSTICSTDDHNHEKEIMPKILKDGNSAVSVKISLETFSSTSSVTLSSCVVATQGLQFLVQLEGGVGGCGAGMRDLFEKYGQPLLQSLIPKGIGGSRRRGRGAGACDKSGRCNSTTRGGISSSNVCSSSSMTIEAVNESDDEGHNADKSIDNNNNLEEDDEEDNDEDFSSMDDCDLRLLICLASSPFGLLFSSPHLLSSMITTLLISSKNAFSQSEQKKMEDVLSSNAEILLAILIPFCYLSYPASTLQLSCYGKSLFDYSKNSSEVSKIFERIRNSENSCSELNAEMASNIEFDESNFDEDVEKMICMTNSEESGARSVYWPGYVTMLRNRCRPDAHSTADSRIAADTADTLHRSACDVSSSICVHLNDLLEVFVASPVWARSPILQCGKRDSDNEEASSFLVRYCSVLFSTLSVSLNPNNSESARIGGVEMIGHVFRLLSHRLPEHSRGEGGRHTLIPYTQRKILEDKHPTPPRQFGYREEYCMIISCAKEGISLMLCALSDGSDAVCVAALEALQLAAPMIPSHEVAYKISEFFKPMSTIILTPGPASFSSVLKKLLCEITTSTCCTVTNNNTDISGISVLDVLDSLVRRLAALDPLQFVQIVRLATDDYLLNFKASDVGEDSLPTLKNDLEPEPEPEFIKRINPVITSTLSGLLDHGDVLVNFMDRKVI